jgi:hypothetical protein
MDGIGSYAFLTLQPIIASYKVGRNFPAAAIRSAKHSLPKVDYWLGAALG